MSHYDEIARLMRNLDDKAKVGGIDTLKMTEFWINASNESLPVVKNPMPVEFEEFLPLEGCFANNSPFVRENGFRYWNK